MGITKGAEVQRGGGRSPVELQRLERRERRGPHSTVAEAWELLVAQAGGAGGVELFSEEQRRTRGRTWVALALGSDAEEVEAVATQLQGLAAGLGVGLLGVGVLGVGLARARVWVEAAATQLQGLAAGG